MEDNDGLKLFDDLREGRLTTATFLDKFREFPKAEQDRLLAIDLKADNTKTASA